MKDELQVFPLGAPLGTPPTVLQGVTVKFGPWTDPGPAIPTTLAPRTVTGVMTMVARDMDAWAYALYDMWSELGLSDPELYARLGCEGALA
jgi:hypothetical protein